jgi:flagellar biosynthesis/type III secretory pathway M-ring protein FliF/YscJ
MQFSDSERSGEDMAGFGRQAGERKVTWTMLLAGAMLLALIGTWLVWFSFVVQRKLNEEDIRAACQRMMPETAERCVDTVIIQRGGVRR